MNPKKKICKEPNMHIQKREIHSENLLRYIEKIFEKRGKKALETARQAVLEEEERLECEEARSALHYFMTEYWYDLARPTLLSLCCAAVDGDPDATIPFAVPLSLISGALDIHDDIVDQSKTKHGCPTVYGKYGKEIALLIADALLFKGFTLLHKAYTQIPTEKATKIMDIIKNMFYELGDAEAMELRLRGRSDVTPEEYLHIVEKKAADTEAHTRIGAIIGNATQKEQENLGKYGRLLGIAFIIGDDITDLVDVKEARHRIKKEHLPLPAIYALTSQKNKSSIYTSAESKTSNADIAEFFKEIEKADGFKLAKQFMEKIVDRALTQIRQIIENEQINKEFIAIAKSLLIV
jgi:geranylgeranyl pyrophosphate synthase